MILKHYSTLGCFLKDHQQIISLYSESLHIIGVRIDEKSLLNCSTERQYCYFSQYDMQHQ